MLWPSIRRWKFQRSSIGKLPTSVCCLIGDCSATTQRAADQHRRRAAAACRAARPTAAPAATAAEPVDDAAEHAEQQRLERADHRRQQRHRQHVAAQAARARPEEGEEAPRRRRRHRLRIGVDQPFEPGEQATLRRGRPAAASRIRTCVRGREGKNAGPARVRRWSGAGPGSLPVDALRQLGERHLLGRSCCCCAARPSCPAPRRSPGTC